MQIYQLRHRFVSQITEMGRLPEKIGLVGCYHIDHVDQFVLHSGGTEEIFKIILEGTHADILQPLCEAGFEHDLFGRGYLYPARVMYEFTQAAEIPVAHSRHFYTAFNFRVHDRSKLTPAKSEDFAGIPPPHPTSWTNVISS